MSGGRRGTRPPGMEQRLIDTATAVEQIPAGTPPLVRLAHAWNGVYTARIVTVLLDAEATHTVASTNSPRALLMA
jgi:hypothetical protein